MITHMTQTDIQRRLAPNGRISNLPPEMWDYVRTPEFKAWFGDWENDPEHASRALDGNGEPLLLWHGSNRDFEAFDLSYRGRNTGGGTWTDRQTGESIPDDAENGIFFSTLRDQAVSYSLLATNWQNVDIRNKSEDMAAFIKAGANYGFKSREDFTGALRELAGLDGTLSPFLEKVLAAPERKVIDLLGEMSEGERNSYADAAAALREEYRERCRMMDHGQQSNSYHNNVRQKAVIESLLSDMQRLCLNDPTVRNDFGTFDDYSCTIFGKGHKTLDINMDDQGRIYFSSEETGRVYLDEADERTILDIRTLMLQYASDAVGVFNQEVERYGFESGANLYACFLNVRSPFAHDYEGSSMPDVYKKTKHASAYIAARQVRKALRDGHDGVVYRNVRDPFLSDTYGVFDTGQIRMVDHQRTMKQKDLLQEAKELEVRRMADMFYGLPSRDQVHLLARIQRDGLAVHPWEVPILDGWGRDMAAIRESGSPEKVRALTERAFSQLSAETMRTVKGFNDERLSDLRLSPDRWFDSLAPKAGIPFALESALSAGEVKGLDAIVRSVRSASQRGEDVREAAKGFHKLPYEAKKQIMASAREAASRLVKEAYGDRYVVLYDRDSVGWTAVPAADREGRVLVDPELLQRLGSDEVAGSKLFCEAYARVMNYVEGTHSLWYYKNSDRAIELPGSDLIGEALKMVVDDRGQSVFATKTKADGYALGTPLKLTFFTDESVGFLGLALGMASTGHGVESGESSIIAPGDDFLQRIEEQSPERYALFDYLAAATCEADLRREFSVLPEERQATILGEWLASVRQNIDTPEAAMVREALSGVGEGKGSASLMAKAFESIPVWEKNDIMHPEASVCLGTNQVPESIVEPLMAPGEDPEVRRKRRESLAERDRKMRTAATPAAEESLTIGKHL